MWDVPIELRRQSESSSPVQLIVTPAASLVLGLTAIPRIHTWVFVTPLMLVSPVLFRSSG